MQMSSAVMFTKSASLKQFSHVVLCVDSSVSYTQLPSVDSGQ